MLQSYARTAPDNKAADEERHGKADFAPPALRKAAGDP
jgi:hypothetical protein